MWIFLSDNVIFFVFEIVQKAGVTLLVMLLWTVWTVLWFWLFVFFFKSMQIKKPEKTSVWPAILMKNIGLQPRKKTAMLVDKSILFFRRNCMKEEFISQFISFCGWNLNWSVTRGSYWDVLSCASVFSAVQGDSNFWGRLSYTPPSLLHRRF